MPEAYDTLLISSSFFGYAAAIEERLRARGRSPLWVEDRPATDTLTKALVRLEPRLIAASANRFFNSITDRLRDAPIREVIVVRGQALLPEAVRHMKETWPEARFILYQWDGYKNLRPGELAKTPLFDKVMTFDILDAKKYGLGYLPLFYRSEYETSSREPVTPDIDFVFVGTLHTDRQAVLSRLDAALPESVKFEKIIYVRSAQAQKALNALGIYRTPLKNVRYIFEPLSHSDIADLYARSRVVVDIERTAQSGYTMRTIEVLASGRRLLTTNDTIRHADFYDSDIIHIVDRKHPAPSTSMLNRSPYITLPGIQKYSLDNWVSTLLA